MMSSIFILYLLTLFLAVIRIFLFHPVLVLSSWSSQTEQRSFVTDTMVRIPYLRTKFIIDFSNTQIIRGRGRNGAETRLADAVGALVADTDGALVCLAPRVYPLPGGRRARHAA